MNVAQLIIKKRERGTHTEAEIQALVRGLVEGTVADYQMSAWLMAAFLNGLDEDETSALCDAMLNSGQVLRLSSVRRPKIDKHSTGGVGDKVSLCLAPLVAAAGVAVPMISGRGLGHTGGTLDKLEAIAGYQTRLDTRRFESIVRRVGTSMIGQTDQLAPADRTIYALRDVTGTVESVPLITASILSKKLAEGIDGLVLDVKVGSGAFMPTLSLARKLARSLVSVGTRANKQVVALLTDMSTPLGRTIGNALETAEAIAVLRDQGEPDTRELTLLLGAEMLVMAGAETNLSAARKRLEAQLASGAAFECFLRMVREHGGDTRMVEHPERLPRAPITLVVPSPKRGFVTHVEPKALALAALELGAGRLRAEQPVDPAVGLVLETRRGETVERGEPLCVIHARTRKQAEAIQERVLCAYTIGPRRLPASKLLLERIAPSSRSPGKAKRKKPR